MNSWPNEECIAENDWKWIPYMGRIGGSTDGCRSEFE